ncbi:MAG: phage tail sheath family protein, partial [Roseivirga sp.]|nr:phage tail sheath family protein [Roseivirga sp.]
VKGGEAPDPKLYTEDIESFRTAVGTNGLSYGAVYYPFLITTVTAENQVSYHNVNNGDLEFLTNFVSNSGSPNAQALQIINTLKNHPDEEEAQISSMLSSICLPYRQLMKIVVEKINTLPPSGAMAGVYTNVDNNSGVWKAPANVAVMSTSALTLNISESMQADLNVDALTGKSINAIRAFMGRGVLVWGARTLDGNSPDWRYINVRRTITMIEQSIKLAMKAYIFELNDANTWIAIKSMISSFLYNIWKQGALQGAKSDDAFSISVGLGSSITAEDIMNGTLRVIVKLAVVLPAEYIVISLEQQQQSS